MIQSIFALSFLFAQPQPSRALEILHVDQKACAQSLNAIIQEHVSGNGTVLAGKGHDLQKILEKSSLHKTQIQNILDVLSYASDLKIPDPILSEVVAIFGKSKDRLNICILNADCHLGMEGAGGMHIKPSETEFYTVQSLGKNIGFSEQQMSAALHEERRRNFNFNSDHFLFLGPDPLASPNLDPFEKYSFPEATFFHELTHFADAQFADHWILANILLIARGMKADELFIKYAKKVGSTYIVSEEFLRFATELRAYHVSQVITELILQAEGREGEFEIAKKIHLMKLILDGLSRMGDGQQIFEHFGLPAKADLRLFFGPTSPKYLAKWKSLAVGDDSLHSKMKATIRRATLR